MTGRNDPCPCGSGKKYKKCCATKDKEESAKRPDLPPRPPAAPRRSDPAPAAFRPLPPLPPPPPRPPLSPLAQRGEERWREYESQTTGEGRAAVFRATLEDELDGAAVMTDDLAFEMLSRLRVAADGGRARFAECLAAFRVRRPEVFDEGAHFYLGWSIQDALADGRRELVAPLARELAGHAGRQIDTFNRTLEALEYHGQLAVLVEVARIAWPSVKSSTDIFEWAVDEFASKGVRYESFDYLERVTAPDPADPILLERVRFFVEQPRDGYLRELIDDLTGTSGREWHTGDFALRPPRVRRRDEWGDEVDEEPEHRTPDPGAVNLGRLVREFVGYLRRAEGVPFTQGELVSEELFAYLVRRHEGSLDPRPSALEWAVNPKAKKPKPPPPAHPLCPDRTTLDAHLGGLVDVMSGRFHVAAALFQRVPAWLRFLESRRLIGADTRRKVADELLPLHADLLKLWQDFPDDPAPYRQVQEWPADAAKEPEPSAPAT